MAEPEVAGTSSRSRSSSAASGSSLRANYISLQAAHQSLLTRIQAQEDDDRDLEVAKLRQRVTELQNELHKSRTEKEELSGTVRDLRTRVEEGRRAIMRLQGAGSSTAGGGSSSAGGSNALHVPSGSVAIGMGANNSNSINNRRSMGPSAFSSWNPQEVFNGGISASPDDELTSQTDESKKSKRASFAFGPNAGSRIMHRRTASGGRGNGEGDGTGLGLMSPPSSTTPGGLRELRLSGPVASSGGTVKASGGDSSKRSSFIAGLFSPSSESSDLPPSEETTTTTTGIGSLLSAGSRSVRRTSNSSSISAGAFSNDGGTADAGSSSLGLPGAAKRNSASPAPSSVHSPILEDGEGEDVELRHRAGLDADDALETAKANPESVPGTFASMQLQQQAALAQRNLQEQTERLKDRDLQLAELRKDLGRLRLELDEAKEARAASENCLKALREFVRDEASNNTSGASGEPNGEGLGDANALRGVKLPPLPTDRDNEEEDGEPGKQALDEGSQTPQSKRNPQASMMTPTASTWKNIGSTFSGFTTRKQSVTSPPLDRRESHGSGSEGGAGTPALSLGSLWSRTAVPASGSTSEAAGTELTGGGADLDKTTSASSSSASSSAGGAKGLSGWFGKAARSGSVVIGPGGGGDGGARSPEEHTLPMPPPPTATSGSKDSSRRISSPPFANLDNNVISHDGPSAMPARTDSASNSPNGSKRSTILNPTISDMEPNGRVRKTMERARGVDEDEGFVPPSF